MMIANEHVSVSNRSCQKVVLATFVSATFFLLMIGLSGLFNPIKAQTPIFIDDPEFREDALTAIDSLYNRKPDVSRKLMAKWESAYPDHPVWSAWSAMESWWDRMVNLYDTSGDDEFFEQMKKADYTASKVLHDEPDHPDALLIKALANGYAARHHANRERWVTAVKIAYTSHMAYARFMEVRPDFPDNLFVEGLKTYYAAFLLDEYPIVKPVSVFLPKGSREEGLRLLEEASETAVFSRAEAAYFLAYILYDYEHDYDQSKTYFMRLADKYPDNSLLQLYYVRTLGELEDYGVLFERSHALLHRWSSSNLKDRDVMEEELYYWLGRCYEDRGDEEQARESYIKSMEAGERFDVQEGRIYLQRSRERLIVVENL